MRNARVWRPGYWLFILLALTACGRQVITPTPSIFIPPTAVATATPLPQPTTTRLATTPTPTCTDQLVFLEDVTIPDGTSVRPDSTLDKRWKVRNAGTCNWDDRYRIRLVDGIAMDAQTDQPLFPARAGTEIEISITFTAPEDPGAYRSAWQAVNPQGQPFGDLFYIEIVIE